MVLILLSHAPYTAHCSLRRAHTARAAVPGLWSNQRRPSAVSPALRRAPSAGQCRPSAGHSVPPGPSAGQCRPSAGHSVPPVPPAQASAGLRPGTPYPSAGLRPANGLHSPFHCGIVCIMVPELLAQEHEHIGGCRQAGILTR